MSKQVPKIRFSGFTDEWEECKFADLYKKVSEKNDLSFSKDQIISVANMYFKTNAGSSSDDSYMRTYNIFRKGDIAFEGHHNKCFSHGRFVENTIGDGIVSHVFDVFRPIVDLDLNYWKYAIHNERVMGPILMTSTTKSTMMTNLVAKDFLKRIMLVPVISEQKEIGNLFSTLDNLITARQKQLDLLKELKKGFLQKMFPKAGETVPEIRFAGFTDGWEQRKLGDLASSFEYGLNASATEYDGENKYLRITDIDDSSHEFIQSGLTSPNTDLGAEENYLLREGDVLFARTGASVGKTYHYKVEDGHIYYAGFLIRARIQPDFDSEFVFQNTVTAKYENFIRVTSQRSGQPGVNAQEYARFELLVPSLSEQRKLGHFFKKIDNTITLHQQKVDALQELKRGFLQQMFI